MYFADSLLHCATKLDLPVLCGVSSIQESLLALQGGASALKFYPASKVNPNELNRILEYLRNDASTSTILSNTPIIVAGGVREVDFDAYLKAGATGFALGFDCQKVSLDCIPAIVSRSVQHMCSFQTK